jgi:type IX secretion system PorP/SprF family membrane protein
MKLLYSCVLLILCTSGGVLAQDLLFSQYNYAPLTVNPALVSAGNDAVISINHRRQRYNNPLQINTSMLNAFHPLNNRRTGTRWGGFGIGVYHDESQDLQTFTNSGAMAAFAYHFNLKGNHHISLGVQGGYFQRRISMEGVTTGSQWIPNVGYDPGAASGESMSNDRISYLNFASGLLWYITDDEGETRGSLGVSGFHLNQPDVSFSTTAHKLLPRWAAHGTYRIYDNRKTSLSAEALYSRTANISNTLGGLRLGYRFEELNPYNPLKSGSIDLGARYAIENKTVIGLLQFNQPAYTIGISYDLSPGSTSRERPMASAFEIVFALKKRIVSKKKEIKIIDNYSLGEIREFYQQEKTVPQIVDTTQTVNVPAPEEKEPFNFKLEKDFKYGFNETELNDDAKLYLDGLYNLLYFNPELKLEVRGHTDKIGTEAANRKVSSERAKNVVDYLESKGVDPKRLKSRGEGSREPIAPEDTEEGRSKNRRVEFMLYKD